MSNYVTLGFEPDQMVPVKAWTKGVLFEEEAQQQLLNVAKLPFIHKWVAAMPDVHHGIGATVGSVIPTRGAIIPAAVGVDIGCGMVAVRTIFKSHALPTNLSSIRAAIENDVPHGRTDSGGRNDKGAHGGTIPPLAGVAWLEMMDGYNRIVAKHPKIEHTRAPAHLGTLGTGNHFIELCLDEEDSVWIMLHSGSRGIGNKIGSYFIDLARADMRKYFINLPDMDLAYLPEGTEHFDDYIETVSWAQNYAAANRRVMLQHVLWAFKRALGTHLNDIVATGSTAINCHHNYVAKENHYGKNVWITRKGAVRARTGDLGIIPGSMGTRSYIVRGLGNDESFHSCSHGAGRKMSRTAARKQFTVEDHVKATEGVECRKDADVVDETPMAYKDIDAVMAAQSDLVEVVHTLKQVLCVKG